MIVIMALQEVRWHPSVCKCFIHFYFDTDIGWKPDGSDTLEPDSIICSAHAGKTLTNILPSVWLDNCLRVRDVLTESLTRFSALRDDTNPNALNPSASFDWSFSGVGDARVLTTTFTGGRTLSPAQKTTLQTALNTRLGAGKVMVT